MRNVVVAAMTIAAFGFIVAGPASARWNCSGPDYVCGGSKASSGSSKQGKSASYSSKKKASKVSESSDEKPAKARKARKVASSSDDSPKPSKAKRRSSGGDSGGGSVYQSGVASYYWQPQKVASGGWFNPNAMTAAHKTLPFGTKVRVTNRNNGQSTVVTINDRGPYISGRIIDLSSAAAGAIGMKGSGVAPVSVAVIGR